MVIFILWLFLVRRLARCLVWNKTGYVARGIVGGFGCCPPSGGLCNCLILGWALIGSYGGAGLLLENDVACFHFMTGLCQGPLIAKE